MGNLAFGNQKPEDIAPKIEEMLREELGGNSPVPYTVEDAGASKTTIGTLLKEGAGLLFGREEVLLFSVVFQLPGKRPATLNAHVNRQGIGAHAGELLYTAELSKPVKSEISLQPPKFFSGPKFEGDPEKIEKLNANKDLLKQLGKLVRTKANVGGVDISIPFAAIIVPKGNGSILVINTLPRMVAMGFKAAMDAKDFLEIAATIEAAL